MKSLFIFITFYSIGVLYSQNSIQGSIETPEMQVFYEGIPVELICQANGNYKQVLMSVPSPFTAAQVSAGSVITIQCTGITMDGKQVDLGEKKFYVKKAPKPELTWGSNEDGSIVNVIPSKLSVGYSDNVPFNSAKAKFVIDSYSISAIGLEGVLEGEGSQIKEEHITNLKKLKGNYNISIQVRFSGVTSGIVSGLYLLEL